MRKRLLNKFWPEYSCLWLWLLILPVAVAKGYSRPAADTCQHPNPPILTGSAKAICRGESVVLNASGCTGQVVWSTGESGPTITAFPQQTTKYTAICRSQPGCISCFAKGWTVTVNTPDAPVISPSSLLVCSGDVVSLTATSRTGVVRWPDQTTGSVWRGRIQQTTVFRATSEQSNCISGASVAVAVQVAAPTRPDVSVSSQTICAGQAVQLVASNCLGKVRWNDGGNGLVRTTSPRQTTRYRAICQVGSCQSDSSEVVTVQVRSAELTRVRVTALTNGCPFLTADLSKAITPETPAGLQYTFRTGPLPEDPVVQSPVAVLAGTYYVSTYTPDGCVSDPVAVTVRIDTCQRGIPPCLSNPATVTLRLDTLDWSANVVTLQARLGGSAQGLRWQSDGNGLFTRTGPNARYLLSETDRQRGTAYFTLSTADPDGDGPCAGAVANLTVVAPPTTAQTAIGLSKHATEPRWLAEGTNRLVEITYQLTAENLGQQRLTQLHMADNLETVFAATGAHIQSVQVRADSGLVLNPAYSGIGRDTSLLVDGSLDAGSAKRLWITVVLDVSQANTLTFSNKAMAWAVDADNRTHQDSSTDGTTADPDRNGNPADNNDPTVVTLSGPGQGEAETVFIPEGFSPNGDGVNDVFVIRRLPPGLTVQMEIYNSFGNLVYQNTDYKNDWDGTANRGLRLANNRQGLPDGTYYYQIRLSDGHEYVRFLTVAR